MKSVSPVSRLLGIALLLSMALNGFLLTPGGKQLAKPDRQRRFSVEGFEERILARLPEADAPRFKAVLAPHRDELARRMEKAGLARDDLRLALDAEPFNRQAAEAAFAKQQSASAEFQQAARSVLLEAAEKLSREGRVRLVDKP